MVKNGGKHARTGAGPKMPDWFKIRLRTDGEYRHVSGLVSGLSLNTVCQHARCPNIYECWSEGTATFLILGNVCTRHCGFCSVAKGKPAPLDTGEPAHVAQAVESLGLDHAVITSVDRDDLSDGGSGHFAATIRAVKKASPACRVEVLVPDFRGDKTHLETVLEAGPDCLGHNVETVPGLYPRVRPVADYEDSLDVLRFSVEWRGRHGRVLAVKSGIMVGLGETMDEVLYTMADIAGTGCEIVTVGQYLPPRKHSLPLVRYYRPDEFRDIREAGLKMGLKHVESGPLVRSSYHARAQMEKTIGPCAPAAKETGS